MGIRGSHYGIYRKRRRNANRKELDIFYNRSEAEVSKNRPKRSERKRANKEGRDIFITGAKWRFQKNDLKEKLVPIGTREQVEVFL